MKLTKKLKKEISEMSYESMLGMWRFDHINIPIFQGESGEYFFGVMSKKKLTADHVKISKKLGWWNKQEKIMSDYKEAIQIYADEIARDDYDKEFYDLREELQDKVYAEAEEQYADNFASRIDSMKGKQK